MGQLLVISSCSHICKRSIVLKLKSEAIYLCIPHTNKKKEFEKSRLSTYGAVFFAFQRIQVSVYKVHIRVDIVEIAIPLVFNETIEIVVLHSCFDRVLYAYRSYPILGYHSFDERHKCGYVR